MGTYLDGLVWIYSKNGWLELPLKVPDDSSMAKHSLKCELVPYEFIFCPPHNARLIKPPGNLYLTPHRFALTGAVAVMLVAHNGQYRRTLA